KTPQLIEAIEGNRMSDHVRFLIRGCLRHLACLEEEVEELDTEILRRMQLSTFQKAFMEMVFSFRPTRMKLFRVMIAPAILPDILTAWKVNLGNASRVVVVAELVGATGGVGYQLLQQQQLFDMAGALAWTLQLVFFVLIVQGALTLIENTVFRYRAVSERAI